MEKEEPLVDVPLNLFYVFLSTGHGGIVTIFLQPGSITAYLCCIICFELTLLTSYTCKRITLGPVDVS